MANFMTGLISLSIGVVILSSVFIRSTKDIVTVNGSTNCMTTYNGSVCSGNGALTGAELALYGLITIAGIAGIVYGTLNVFGLA